MGEVIKKEPDENTVIGTAKTIYSGRLIYVDILYGNVVRLPDGTQSSVDPAIYAKLLEAYLNIPDADDIENSESADEKKLPEQGDFIDSSLYVLQKGELTQYQKEKADAVHSDKESFFYREGSCPAQDETEEIQQAYAKQTTEEVPFDEPGNETAKPEAASFADTDDDVPDFLTSKPGKRRKTAVLIGVCIAIVLALLIALYMIS